MKHNKCPFCSVPCNEDHCAWNEGDPKPSSKPEKTNKDEKDVKK